MKSNLTFVLLTTGRESAQELQAVLSSDHRVRVLATSDSAETVLAETLRWQPSAVILSLGSDPRAAWELSRRIHAAHPDTLIICASHHSTPEMILESLRAGACEFLRLPIIAEEFNTVLGRVQLFSTDKAQEARKPGRILAVCSGKGGSGTSFIAANLAASLETPAVLVDLDLRSGNQDVFFGVKPKFSIHDMVVNRARLDDELLTNFLSPLGATLKLLAAPREIEFAPDLQAEHLCECLRFLRDRYDHIVLDLPHHLDATSLAALDQADEIVLVFTLDLLAARGAQRSLLLFNRLGYPRQKIKLVANRVAKNNSLDLTQVEQFLGGKIACCLSNDYPRALDSINQGQPLVRLAPISPLATEIRKLAGVCGINFPETEPTPRPGFFSSLFRRPTAALDAPAILDKA
jgi:pilus assembly protein CpaE